MNVLLINPSYWTGDKKPLGYFNLSTIPLGLGYIAAALESKGIAAKILDTNILDMESKELEARLLQIHPDIVGITSFTSNYKNAVKVANMAKKTYPETFVVMGGVHATFMFEDILTNVPSIDAIALFEGEATMCELADSLEKSKPLNEIKGLAYRDGTEIQANPIREKLEDLDTLTYPALHLLEPSVDKYIEINGDFPMITTRGCPFNCIFCSTAAFHGRKYRVRETSKIVNEIEYVVEKYKVKRISFVDDNFTMLKDRVVKLCREMKERKISIKWGCSSRVDQLSEELLKVMIDAGCEAIFFGVESVSQHVLNLVKKGFNIQQARDTIKLCEKMGIKTDVSFILGLPGESADSLSEMARFVEETKPTGRALPNILDIPPGTDLYAKKEKYFSGQPIVDEGDITKAQLEIFLALYKNVKKTNELMRVRPPEIIVES